MKPHKVDGEWVWGERPTQQIHHRSQSLGEKYNGSSDKLPKPKAFKSRVILRKAVK